MNNKINEALVIMTEECGELIQSSSKVLRFGLTEESRDKLVEECGDVLAMIGILAELGVVSHEEINKQVDIKREKLTRWSNLFNETEV